MGIRKHFGSWTMILLMITGGFIGFISFEPGLVEALNIHSPIVIDGNDNFTTANGVTSGNGTASDPYIIENWTINATAENGIFIMNSNVHFIIRNVEIYSTGTTMGIYLYNVSHAVIENSTLRNTQFGILLRRSSNSTIVENRFGVNTYALYIDDHSINNSVNFNNFTSNGDAIFINNYSDNISIMNNDLSQSFGWSITLSKSSNNKIISNNIMNSTGENGIYLYDSCINNTIDSNNISSVGSGIVIVTNSDQNTVINNNITNCGSDGILIGASHNNVSNNVVYGNGGAGLNLGPIVQIKNYNKIYNNEIYNNSEGIKLLSADHNNITKNVIIRNEINGLYMSESIFNNVSGNNVSDNYDGIYLTSNCNFNELSFNEVYNNSNDGINIRSSYLNKIDNNSVSRNDQYGIRIWSSGGNNVTVNNASDNYIGIDLRSSSGGRIYGNDVYFNYNVGIRLGFSSNMITIEQNTIVNNRYGIYVYSCDDLVIRDNKVYHNYDMGMNLEDLYMSSLEYNDVYYNRYGGINLDDCWDIIIDHNNISYNSVFGVYILYGHRHYIGDNLIKWNDAGIHVIATREIEFERNELVGNGIYLFESDLPDWRDVILDTSNTVNGGPVYFWTDRQGGSIPQDAGQVFLINSETVKVENLNIQNSTAGITLAFSSDCIIANNTSSWNSYYGIQLVESNDNSIKDNIFSNNQVQGIHIESSSLNNIIRSNICNYNQYVGIYLVGVSDNEIINNHASFNGKNGITYDYLAENVVVTGNICNYNAVNGIRVARTIDSITIISSNIADNNGGSGIEISDVDYATVENNYCRWNGFSGISLSQVYWSDISNNDLKYNNQSGMILGNSEYNLINDSTFSNNKDHGLYIAGSDGNNVIDNDFFYNEKDGIRLWVSDNNWIYENTILNNKVGMTLDESDDNFIYHNSFISNDVQASEASYSDSDWNTAYPTGGNYWDDLAGMDTYQGEDQSEPGRDGICDQAYTTGNVTDFYPLMKPLGQRPAPPEDLKVTAGINYVNISWALPDDDVDFPVIKFIVKRALSVEIEVPYNKGSGSVYYNDTGVAPGKTYYYAIIAINIVGESLPSGSINATPGSVPPPPKDLRAYDEGENISLNWKTPLNNGGFPIQNYRLYKGIAPGAEVFFKELDLVYTYFDENVVKGVTYYYRITAVNERGEGPVSNEANATIYSVPQAPKNLTGLSGDRYVYLTWAPPYNTGGHPILKYYVYKNTTSGEFESISKLDADQLWYNDTDVDYDITYYYKLRALNEIDKGPFTEAIGVTPERAKIKPGNELPRAFISVEVTEGPPPLNVNFTGSGRDNDGVIMSYSWDFGDSTTSTEQSPNHTYDAPGTYYVKLYVFDNEGGSSMAMVTITVTRDLPPGGDREDESPDEEKSSAWPMVAVGVGAVVVAVVVIVLILFVLPIFMRKPPPDEDSKPSRQVREVTVYRIIMTKRSGMQDMENVENPDTSDPDPLAMDEEEMEE